MWSKEHQPSGLQSLLSSCSNWGGRHSWGKLTENGLAWSSSCRNTFLFNLQSLWNLWLHVISTVCVDVLLHACITILLSRHHFLNSNASSSGRDCPPSCWLCNAMYPNAVTLSRRRNVYHTTFGCKDVSEFQAWAPGNWCGGLFGWCLQATCCSSANDPYSSVEASDSIVWSQWGVSIDFLLCWVQQGVHHSRYVLILWSTVMFESYVLYVRLAERGNRGAELHS